MGEWEITNKKIADTVEDFSTLMKWEDDFIDNRILAPKIRDMLNEPKKNPIQELKEWRKIGKNMLVYMKMQAKLNKNMLKQQQRLVTMKSDRSGKKWTPEEDEVLIELICDDEFTLLDVSKTLGRSISAIQTRCSFLTGVENTKKKIQGKFQGKLNGLVIDGTIDGLLIKKGGSR